MDSKKVLVSACLIGKPCRYDGQHKLRENMVELHKAGETLAICPEELGGLPTPRSPAEMIGDKVLTREGRDVTGEYLRGANETLRLAKESGVTEAYLKTRSPMCGCKKVYDGSFSGNLVDGDGILTKLLIENGIHVHPID